MAVETPRWLKSALTWRWTPTIALLLGSLVYVAVAIAVVPAQIDFSGKASSATAPGAAAPETAVPAEAATPEAAAEAPPTRRARRRRVASPAPAEEQPPAPAEAPPPESTPPGGFVRPFNPNDVPPAEAPAQ